MRENKQYKLMVLQVKMSQATSPKAEDEEELKLPTIDDCKPASCMAFDDVVEIPQFTNVSLTDSDLLFSRLDENLFNSLSDLKFLDEADNFIDDLSQEQSFEQTPYFDQHNKLLP